MENENNPIYRLHELQKETELTGFLKKTAECHLSHRPSGSSWWCGARSTNRITHTSCQLRHCLNLSAFIIISLYT